MTTLVESMRLSASCLDGWVQHALGWMILGALVELIHRFGGTRISPRLRGLLWSAVIARSLLPPGVFGLRTRAVSITALELPVAAIPVALVVVWATGALLCLLHAFRGREPAGRARRAEEGSALALILERLGHSAHPHWLIGNDSRLRAPAVIGPLRSPRLWIPEAWLESDRKNDLIRALAHELAHLERHDLWRKRALEIWRAIFWFHPMAHLAVRRLDELREVACDRSAAERLGESPALYASWLAHLALSECTEVPGALALGGRPNSIVRRVESVMRAGRFREPTRWHQLCELSALALFLGLLLPPRVDVIASSVTPITSRPPGCLELRYRVMAELAKQDSYSPPTLASR